MRWQYAAGPLLIIAVVVSSKRATALPFNERKYRKDMKISVSPITKHFWLHLAEWGIRALEPNYRVEPRQHLNWLVLRVKWFRFIVHRTIWRVHSGHPEPFKSREEWEHMRHSIPSVMHAERRQCRPEPSPPKQCADYEILLISMLNENSCQRVSFIIKW